MPARSVSPALLAATTTTLRRLGPRQFSLTAVAEAAGVSRGTVHNALGSRDAAIKTALDYLASAFVETMAAEVDILARGPSLLSSESVGTLLEAANKSKEPLRNFLNKKITAKDRALFFNLAKKMRTTEEDRQQLTEKDFMIIVPAFVVSELKEAFQIGFLLFVPFIVIDMVVANILLALGMQMLSPTTISMPFKLLLFVVVDGWYLIAKGLVVGYL